MYVYVGVIRVTRVAASCSVQARGATWTDRGARTSRCLVYHCDVFAVELSVTRRRSDVTSLLTVQRCDVTAL